ncbi:UDP-3-O-(3-hydroxymyristoyl)glucosamine N-acyltransferase [Pseudooceanicola sp. HF7]|uniref:UDP-3-O-(3-hydroxymyristoyl)glucosamine N-acyltransferase n=1 Tax=Pseudooceanicola sp. HF7 TaxID=2721560 RepID=UPI00142FDE4F|nr:UDP-3-O-(3-hydroxymyristoyl)glucosamine N-acyltransferase [Pseudooceanicola sp. HF7]NIZ08718.1 UDP-3-O-(3-hydroxymyristoyl)glucosamine N-acyltransferase [Pseudooceanicola sp. HF7]
MAHSIQDIAEALGCKALGDTSLTVTGVAEPASATADTLALAMKPEFAEDLPKGKARAAILWEGADWETYGLEAALFSPRPRMAMSGLTAMMDPGPGFAPGIHSTAIIDPSAHLEADVSVGPYTIIAAGVRIGAGTVIGPQCHLGTDVQIGPGALLHPGVRIGPRVKIGARFIAHPNAVIGSDGFSFVTPEESNVERARATLDSEFTPEAQAWVRIHSLGSVVIGDDVELGSLVAVDAGTVRPTQIGSGTKIDNHCHIGHNCVIGRDCLFAAFAGIAGSTQIGNNVVFGGRVGVADNLKIGDGVIGGGGSAILSNVPAGRFVMGSPAVKMDQHMASYKALRRLPRLAAQVAELQKAVFKRGEKD